MARQAASSKRDRAGRRDRLRHEHREDEELRRFYFRLQSCKNSAVALVAVARKLVLRLYRMLREEIDYEEFRRRGRDARRARVGQSSVARLD